MEKKEEDSGVKFIKALQECPSFAITDGESCNPDDIMDADEEDRKIEAMLQLAIDDLKNIQKNSKTPKPYFQRLIFEETPCRHSCWTWRREKDKRKRF